LGHQRERASVHAHQTRGFGILVGVGGVPGGVHAPEQGSRLCCATDEEGFCGEGALDGGGVGVGDDDVAEFVGVAGSG